MGISAAAALAISALVGLGTSIYSAKKQEDMMKQQMTYQAQMQQSYLDQVMANNQFTASDTASDTDTDTTTQEAESDTQAKAQLAFQQEQERVNPLTVMQLTQGNQGILGSWTDDDTSTTTSRHNLLNI